MQINCRLRSEKNIVLPIHYNYLLQAFIYNNIDASFAEFLHGTGYEVNRRSFKLFTFSRLYGMIKLDKTNGVAVYGNTGEFTFCSPIDEICTSVANQLLNRESLFLGENMVYVEQLQVEKPKVKEEQITVTTLSPIVVYSTFYKYDKQKYTCYFMPGEADYERLITENLKKKYKAFTGIDHYGENLVIKPLGRIKQSIVYYKNTVIKGCVGKFMITGDKDLLQMGIEAGFGSKNSQGFGCVKLV